MRGELLRGRRPSRPLCLGGPTQYQRVALNGHFCVPLEPDLCEQWLRDHDSLRVADAANGNLGALHSYNNVAPYDLTFNLTQFPWPARI